MAELLIWAGGLMMIADGAYRLSSSGPMYLRSGKVLTGRAKTVQGAIRAGIGLIAVALSGVG